MNDGYRIKRRQALMLGGVALVATALRGRLYAAPVGGPRLLVVFLRGGYDCNNLLIPYASSDYYECRPTLAIARPNAMAADGALALDAEWALAPAVRDTLGDLYAQRQAAFIPFAGTQDLSRSHFETQDKIELGQSDGGRDYRSGFLARLAGVLRGRSVDVEPIAFTDALPLAFEGDATVPNLSLRNVGKMSFDARQAEILRNLYAGHHLETAVSSGLELRHEVAEDMPGQMNAANRNAVDTRGFELEAVRMGRMMRDRFRLGFVDVGGWDTHVGEGAATGPLATNLGNLGRGLHAFSQSLGAEWRNTVVVVLSEFGRTFRENGSRGTDHGHGTVYWVLGGSIHGGQIVGNQQRVQRSTLFQDRDHPVLNDYRAVLGGLFRSMWGLTPGQSASVFPDAPPADLGLT